MKTHVFKHPYCLYVNQVKGKDDAPDKFFFQLPLFPQGSMFSQQPNQSIRQGRVFSCQRVANELLEAFFDRLACNIQNHFNGAAKKEINKTLIKANLKLMRGSTPFDGKIPLKIAFSRENEQEASSLCVELEKQETETLVLQFDVQKQPAMVQQMSLELLPQVGCPLIPALETVNFCFKKSKFQWFVSKSTKADLMDAEWPLEPTSTEYVFTPEPEHVGHYVRVRVMPHDAAGRPGLPFGSFHTAAAATVDTGDSTAPFVGEFVICKQRVVHAPRQEFHQARYRETNQRLDEKAGEFRLVSYNILAFMYSVTESARTFFFRHCPPRYLEPDYRFPLIFRELLKYKSDVLCLQEVDTFNFRNYLVPLLEDKGNFEGVYLPKLLIQVPENTTTVPPPLLTPYPRKAEGPAIFYNANRYRLVQKFEVDSLLMAAEDFDDLAADLELLSSELELWYIMRARAQGLVACLLEEKTSGRRLLVVCTHLYFQPTATKLRQVQCAAVRRIVRKLAIDYATEVNGKKIPLQIFIGADLNTEPGSGPYMHLCSELGDPAEEREFRNKGTSFKFNTAYNLPLGTFTNLVPGFKGILDSILFSTPDDAVPCWTVNRTLKIPSEMELFDIGRRALAEDASLERPVCSENEGGLTLPNSQFPSDHLALVVDFSIKEP